MNPKITAIMPVYNAERFLAEAIESTLSQNQVDFEYIIIDDSSKDNSLSIIKRYTDPRIIFVQNERNIGIARSLNRGIALARGKYIARVDADDVNLPNRFYTQEDFLDKNPLVSVVGTAARLLNETGVRGEIIEFPTAHILIYWRLLLFSNPIIHPSVMIRTKLLREVGGYNIAREVSQDYELWSRLATVSKLANLPEVFLYLRKHDKNISKLKEAQQFDYAVDLCRQLYADQFGIKLDDSLLNDFAGYFRRGQELNTSNSQKLFSVIITIAENLIMEETSFLKRRMLFKAVQKNADIILNHIPTKSIRRELRRSLFVLKYKTLKR